MWSPTKRGRKGNPGAVAVAQRTIEEFDGSDEELRAEIERLTEHNRERPAGDRERELLHLRNLMGIRLLESEPRRSDRPEPDFDALPDVDPLPEVRPEALTPELLRAGILRNGCLLVRGFLPRQDSVQLAARIDRSFKERARHDANKHYDDRFYEPFLPDPRRGVRLLREWVKSGGGVLAVDSPLLSFELREMFRAAGLPELLQAYLGEAPVVAADKATLRKAEPTVPGGWHQDGKFMGEVNALNLWLSLSNCGEDAPGLDIVPRRLEQHVTTETDEAMMVNMVSQRVAEEAAAEKPILRPIFEPGDALLFDELFLHKTASEPSMRRARFAIENWFFGASAFPQTYVPLAV
jgi:Phytanoyl-CoA dioxygenase (PhyH)